MPESGLESPDGPAPSLNPPKPRKRIIIACDGTWMNSDAELQVPSNVTRICRCIKSQGSIPPEDSSNERIPQIIYYQSGVGTVGGAWAHIVGGATGLGKHLMTDAAKLLGTLTLVQAFPNTYGKRIRSFATTTKTAMRYSSLDSLGVPLLYEASRA